MSSLMLMNLYLERWNTESYGIIIAQLTRGDTTWTIDLNCREVKTGFSRKRSMQTGSSDTLIDWKSGKTTWPFYGTEWKECGYELRRTLNFCSAANRPCLSDFSRRERVAAREGGGGVSSTSESLIMKTERRSHFWKQTKIIVNKPLHLLKYAYLLVLKTRNNEVNAL